MYPGDQKTDLCGSEQLAKRNRLCGANDVTSALHAGEECSHHQDGSHAQQTR